MGLRINTPNVISEIIEGEAVVINLETGNYYSIGKVGAIIWGHIRKNTSQNEIAKKIAEHFNIELTVAQNDVTAFIEELIKESLIINDEASDQPSQQEDAADQIVMEKTSYEKPQLTKFEDMQDLLLLDPIHDVNEEGWPRRNTDSS